MGKKKQPHVDFERLSVVSRVYAEMSGDPDWDALDDAARNHYLGECRQLILVLDAFDKARHGNRVRLGQQRGSKPWARTPKMVRLETEAGRKAAAILMAGGTFAKVMRETGLGGAAINTVATELRSRGHVLANSPVAPGRRAGRVPVQEQGAGAEMVRGLVEVHSPTFR
jgi:hypothetical protein